MIFSRNLIDKWDPDFKFRNDTKLTCVQIITFPFLCIGLLFTLTVDLISLPVQMKMFYSGD